VLSFLFFLLLFLFIFNHTHVDLRVELARCVANYTVLVRVDPTIMRVKLTRKVFLISTRTGVHLSNQYENSPVSLKLIVKETLTFHPNTT
jgi:hypothetical protein